MPGIRDLIDKLEHEDEIQRQEEVKHLNQQKQKYQELFESINILNEENKQYTENIVKGLDQLVATKHTIEQTLEQTDNLTGLPIPYEQHGSVVDLMSNITKFMNNIDDVTAPSHCSPSKIHQDVINVTESIASDLKECHTEVAQAQTLYYNTKLLKSLTTDIVAETLDNSFLDPIMED